MTDAKKIKLFLNEWFDILGKKCSLASFAKS